MTDENLVWSKTSSGLMRIGSSLSIVGSVTICCTIFHGENWRDKLSKTKQRLLLGMSVMDILNSTAYAFATSPIPEDAPGTQNVYGNKGNRVTCEVQGFFIQLGFAVPLYSCSLSLYFLLVMFFGKSRDYISSKFEPSMHFVSISYPLITSALGLFLRLYNSNNSTCWIEPYPYKCSHRTDIPCTRGNDAYTYQWIFAGSIVSVSFLFILGSMIAIVYKVWRSQSKLESTDYRETKETGRQALLYIGAFLITWSWGVSIVLLEQYGYLPNDYIIYLFSLFQPMQGFWNVLVYLMPAIRQKYQQSRGRERNRCSRERREASNLENIVVSIESISIASEDIKNNVAICDVTIDKSYDITKPRSLHKLPSFITIHKDGIKDDMSRGSLSSTKEGSSTIDNSSEIGCQEKSFCAKLSLEECEEESSN